jgi:serine/threonine protein kinase
MALEYCHDIANIIHRDIKPDNILVDHGDNIKLADFGVSSQLAADGEDRIHSNAGTMLFNSPEAFLG